MHKLFPWSPLKLNGCTHGDGGTPQEGRERAHSADPDDVRDEEQVVHGGTLAGEDDDREEDERADEVGIPRQVQRAALNDVEAAIDDNGVHRRDHRARDAEEDAE